MGNKFDIKCERCDYSFTANVGHGFRGCGFFETNPDTGKPYFNEYIKSKKILADVNRILNTEKNVHEDEIAYGHRISWRGHGSAQYLCPKCGRFHNNFYFKLTFTGGTYEPAYFCTKCKSKLLLIDIIEDNDIYEKNRFCTILSAEQINWRCPLCDHDKLVIDDNASTLYYD